MKKYLFTLLVFIGALYLIVSNYNDAIEISIASMAVDNAITDIKREEQQTELRVSKTYPINDANLAKLKKMYTQKTISKGNFIRKKGDDKYNFVVINTAAYDIAGILSKTRLALNSKYNQVKEWELVNYKTVFNQELDKQIKDANISNHSFVLEIDIKKPELTFGRFTNGYSLDTVEIHDIDRVYDAYTCGLQVKKGA